MKKSKSQSLIALAILPLLVIGLCLVTPGCGGGANAVTTVSIKSAELEASETANNGEEGPDNGDSTAATGEPGSLVGRFTFDGTAPDLAPLVSKGEAVKDAQYCSAEAVPNQSLVVGDDGGLANVFIYLPEAPRGYSPEGDLPELEFDQKGCQFLPHGLVVQTGQTVLVKNGDGAPHNTNMKVVRNSPFNQVVNANDRNGVPLVYNQVERTPIKAACDFHAWMSGYHLVVDHPFAACSKADGTFEIKNLPPGKYTFRVWHESASGSQGYLERSLKVEIKPGQPAKVEKSYKIGSFKL